MSPGREETNEVSSEGAPQGGGTQSLAESQSRGNGARNSRGQRPVH